MGIIINTASQAGLAEFKAPGEVFFRGAAIAYLLQSTGRSVYDDNPRARLRQNVMFYGPHGAVKTTCAKAYLYDYCGAADLATMDPGHDLAIVLDMGGKGMTWERQRGGATAAGDFIPPLLMEPDFAVVPELFSTLGHTPATQAERMDTFNEMLEEGRITVSLSKMFNKSEEEREELSESIREASNGRVHYNAKHAIISYDVRLSTFACSRYFTKNQDEMLEYSGFQSRFSFAAWHPDHAAFAAYRRDPYGVRDESKWKVLRALNERAWRTTYDEVPYPPKHMVSAMMDFFFRTYERISEETNIPVGELSGSRDTVTAAQLLTACAIDRTIWEMHRSKDETLHVKRLDYTEDDLWLAKQLSMPRLQQLYDNNLGKAGGDPHQDSADALLLAYHEHLQRKQRATGEDVSTFSAKQFVPWATDRNDVSRATAYRRLKSMLEAGFIERTGEDDGIYWFTDRWLKRHSLSDSADDEEDEAVPYDAIFDPSDLEALGTPVGEES